MLFQRGSLLRDLSCRSLLGESGRLFRSFRLGLLLGEHRLGFGGAFSSIFSKGTSLFSFCGLCCRSRSGGSDWSRGWGSDWSRGRRGDGYRGCNGRGRLLFAKVIIKSGCLDLESLGSLAALLLKDHSLLLGSHLGLVLEHNRNWIALKNAIDSLLISVVLEVALLDLHGFFLLLNLLIQFFLLFLSLNFSLDSGNLAFLSLFASFVELELFFVGSDGGNLNFEGTGLSVVELEHVELVLVGVNIKSLNVFSVNVDIAVVELPVLRLLSRLLGGRLLLFEHRGVLDFLGLFLLQGGLFSLFRLLFFQDLGWLDNFDSLFFGLVVLGLLLLHSLNLGSGVLLRFGFLFFHSLNLSSGVIFGFRLLLGDSLGDRLGRGINLILSNYYRVLFLFGGGFDLSGGLLHKGSRVLGLLLGGLLNQRNRVLGLLLGSLLN